VSSRRALSARDSRSVALGGGDLAQARVRPGGGGARQELDVVRDHLDRTPALAVGVRPGAAPEASVDSDQAALGQHERLAGVVVRPGARTAPEAADDPPGHLGRRRTCRGWLQRCSRSSGAGREDSPFTTVSFSAFCRAWSLPPGSRRGFARLRTLVQETGAERVIVGLPLTLSGSDSAQTRETRAFAQRLQNAIAVPVALYDERSLIHI